jgi:hypothetical protein
MPKITMNCWIILVAWDASHPNDPEPSIWVRPEMFSEIHLFSGPVSGPRIEQEYIFSAQIGA